MIATVTSKGQVTLPKEIRDALGIETGTQLDFRATEDGRIEARKVEANPLAIVGLLKRLKRRRPVSVEEMNEAVLKEAAARFRRSKR